MKPNSTNTMRKNDVFRWCYSPEQRLKMDIEVMSGTLYWCCSQIAIFNGTNLVDTYWTNGSENLILNKLVCFEQGIILEYRGNLDDYESGMVTATSKTRYKYSDILDLRHANDTSDALIYLKKGAKEDEREVIKDMRYQLSALVSKKKDLDQDIARLQLEITTALRAMEKAE